MKVGIIGGSGLDDPEILENQKEIHVTTPFGEPSDALLEGTIAGVPCVLLARHGRKHSLMPANINFRANIWALKSVGCTHVLASNACGGLQEHTKPGDLVVLDQFFDRTQAARKHVANVYEPGKPRTAEGPHLHTTGSCVTIEGPRFSSCCESRVFHSWGLDVINMTLVPEVVLAKEAGLCYSSIAIVTDYDSWKASEVPVSVEVVIANFKKTAETVKKVFVEAIKLLQTKDWTKTVLKAQALAEQSRQDVH
ncbi:unnamed protein product [Dibothriocephalus latus]|uniref:S-methyl-5'-thioadenosine phosphorylase n=1 Tax=Dibothriocephalus latus TaxID=60516 RepID=A0A3P7PC87_DIBLA|nr:unnamed protein product [Dibothriocephalus latus]